MSEEINKDPKDVNEELEVIIATGDKAISIDDFVNKVDQVKRTNAHKAYETFNISMITKNGAAVLMFSGTRKETQDELNDRTTREQIKKKNLEEQELKDYIRLKKKFEKKNSI